MPQVHKYIKNDTFNQITKVELVITQNNLTYTTTGSTELQETVSLSLADVRNSLSFAAQNWVSPLKGNVNDKLISLLAWSDITKRDTLSGSTSKDGNFNLRFFIKHTSDTFEDFIYQIGLPVDEQGNFEDSCEIVITGGTLSEDPLSWKSVFSPINLTSASITEGTEFVEVTVTSTDTGLEKVYLEPVCGILDRTVVNLTNGSGKFKVVTNTLEAGDSVIVKAGHKKFSNVTTFTKTIS